MTDRESSWALAPPRDLDVLEKEEFSDWDGVTEQPSFYPELMSSVELREKARSSGYGKDIPSVARVELAESDIRPWQEEPTFKPELPRDAKRDQAKGSAYGKQIPQIVKKEPEPPKFKPEITRSGSAKKLHTSVKSSGYGRNVAAPRPKSAPAQPSFRPEMPKSRLRSQAKSSQYGKVSASRPQSANNTPQKSAIYVPRYTLLSDRPDPTFEDESASNNSFVLDGIKVTSSLSKLELSFPPAPKQKLTPKHKQLRDSAASSAYGIASPPIGNKVEPKVQPAPLKFDKMSKLDEPLVPHPTKTPLADKVRSSAYGKVPPAVGAKPFPKEPEPEWKLTLKTQPLASDLPPAPKSSLNEKVASNQYGKASPKKGPKYELSAAPLWIPSNNPRVKSSELAPVPRSKLNDQVQSHYGSHYDPSSLYAFNNEEEFDADVDGQQEYTQEQVYVQEEEQVHYTETEQNGNGAHEEEEFEAY